MRSNANLTAAQEELAASQGSVKLLEDRLQEYHQANELMATRNEELQATVDSIQAENAALKENVSAMEYKTRNLEQAHAQQITASVTEAEQRIRKEFSDREAELEEEMETVRLQMAMIQQENESLEQVTSTDQVVVSKKDRMILLLEAQIKELKMQLRAKEVSRILHLLLLNAIMQRYGSNIC